MFVGGSLRIFGLGAPAWRRHVDGAAIASVVGCGHGRPRAAEFAAALPGGARLGRSGTILRLVMTNIAIEHVYL